MERLSIKKNFLYSNIYQVISVITPFITAPYLSRVLGAEAIGIQSYTSSINTYFTMFVALGTMSYGAREISRCRNEEQKRSKIFWEIEILTLVSALICICVWLILAFQSKEYGIYYFILTLCLISTAFDISWFFTGLEQFRLIVVRNTIFKLVGVVCLFLFIKSSDDLLRYMMINSLTMLASTLTFWPYLKRFIVKVPIKELKIIPHLKNTFVYFIPTIATSVYTILDKSLLGWLTANHTEIGYYQQAEKIINIAKSVVFTSINSVVSVRISYLFVENKMEEVIRRIHFSMNYILFMGIGCMFGLIGVAKNFVPLFFGSGYDGVVWLLYLFSPIVVIIGISNCLESHYYTPVGKRAQSNRFLLIGSVVNLALNLILIPRFLAYGAAVASVFAEIVITTCYLIHCSTVLTVVMLLKIAWRKMLAGIWMLLSVFAVELLELHRIVALMIQIILGAVIYILGLLLLKDRWMIQLVKNVYFKWRK